MYCSNITAHTLVHQYVDLAVSELKCSLSLNIAVIKQRFRRSKQHTCLNQSQIDIITDLHRSKHSMASISRSTKVHVNTIRRIVKQLSQHKIVSAKITKYVTT